MSKSDKDHIKITVEARSEDNPPKAFLAQCEAITKEGKRCRCNVHNPQHKYCAFHMEKEFGNNPFVEVYYNTLDESETQTYVRFIELGDNLEHEIAMTRIYLMRAMKELSDCQKSTDEGAKLIVEFEDKGWSDQFGNSSNVRKVNKEVLLKKEVRDLMGKLKDLMKVKFEISGDRAEDAQAKAQKLIQALKDMQALREDEKIIDEEHDDDAQDK